MISDVLVKKKKKTFGKLADYQLQYSYDETE